MAAACGLVAAVANVERHPSGLGRCCLREYSVPVTIPKFQSLIAIP
jgi:hypothetical protein